MKHIDRTSRFATINQPTTIIYLLILALLSITTAQAQNPSYAFANRIGGVGSDQGHDIATDANGNIYVTGRFEGTVDFDPGSGTANLATTGSGDPDIYVASYGAAGAYRWAFRIGSTGWDEGRAIAIDGNGNVVVAGGSQGTADFDPGSGTANLAGGGSYVAKYTSNGAYILSYQLATVIFDFALDASGNVIVTGNFHGSVDFDPSSRRTILTSTKVSKYSYSYDIFVAKYSTSGTYLWAFKVSSAAGGNGRSVAIDASGNIYVAGEFGGTMDFNPGSGINNLTSAGEFDGFVAKFTSAGVYGWAYRFGGGFADAAQANAVDGSGNVVVTGQFRGTVDFDPGPATASLTSTGTVANMFIARFSPTGNFSWVFAPNAGAPVASPNCFDIDGNGDIYVVGGFNASLGANDFDPGPGTTSFAGIGGYVVSYDASGNYRWGFALDSASGRGIAVDGSGDVHVIGGISGTTDFDPSTDIASLTSAGLNDAFIAKYTTPLLPKHTPVPSRGDAGTDCRLSVAPNPFTNTLTLTYDGTSHAARIEFVDMKGRTIETIAGVAAGGEIQLGENLPAGVYLVRVIENESVRQMLVRKVR